MRGLFSGRCPAFRGKRQLAHPDFELWRGRGGAKGGRVRGRADPDLPGDRQLPSWTDRRLGAHRGWMCSTSPRTRSRLRQEKHRLRAYADALRASTPADEADEQQSRFAAEWTRRRAAGGAAQRRLAAADYWRRIPRPLVPGGLLAAFDAALPFELTVGQQLAGATIADALAATTR